MNAALRDVLAESLAGLALARERLMSFPDPIPAPRSDGCPECGAFPGVDRSYRAWVPSGGRCVAAWHVTEHREPSA